MYGGLGILGYCVVVGFVDDDVGCEVVGGVGVVVE